MGNPVRIGQKVQNLYERIKWSTGNTPTYLSFGQEQLAEDDRPAAEFRGGQHYFQVRINEMFLAHEREWFLCRWVRV